MIVTREQYKTLILASISTTFEPAISFVDMLNHDEIIKEQLSETLVQITNKGTRKVILTFRTYVDLLMKYSVFIQDKTYDPIKVYTVYLALRDSEKQRANITRQEQDAFVTVSRMFYKEIYNILLKIYAREEKEMGYILGIELGLPKNISIYGEEYELNDTEIISELQNGDTSSLNAFIGPYKDFTEEIGSTLTKLMNRMYVQEELRFIAVLYKFFKFTDKTNLNILKYEGEKIACR